eukprot:GHVS01035096.1.p1 GENE.GHVS01035096.1~~GHVS01035096.1.p1  ORF type:complete len:517 (-),score=74.35 GHVS01035096.1:2185-3735(-)
MYSVRVLSSDPLYSILSAFLAETLTQHRVVVHSRADYRDHSYQHLTLDYGVFSLSLPAPEQLEVQVTHLPPASPLPADTPLPVSSSTVSTALTPPSSVSETPPPQSPIPQSPICFPCSPSLPSLSRHIRTRLYAGPLVPHQLATGTGWPSSCSDDFLLSPLAPAPHSCGSSYSWRLCDCSGQICREYASEGRRCFALEGCKKAEGSVERCKKDVVCEEEESCFILQSADFNDNLKLLEQAARYKPNKPQERIVSVFAWEGGWHQRQAAFVGDCRLSASQQVVANAAEKFYGDRVHFQKYNLPYQRGIILSGPSASGKHWLSRHLCLVHNKSMCYLPVTDLSYAAVGPAIACAPMNSLIVIDGLPQFYQRIPSSERVLFLRHLESVFNTSVCDPKGLLVVLLAPSTMPVELERFLRMPHRFQNRFDITLSSPDLTKDILRAHIGGKEDTDAIEQLAQKLSGALVSAHVLRWFFGENKQQSSPQLLAMLEDLLQMVKEERHAIDSAQIGQGYSERMYC